MFIMVVGIRNTVWGFRIPRSSDLRYQQECSFMKCTHWNYGKDFSESDNGYRISDSAIKNDGCDCLIKRAVHTYLLSFFEHHYSHSFEFFVWEIF